MREELLVIVKESGMTSAAQDIIVSHFEPFFLKAKEWNEKAKELVVTDETQTDLMKEARTSRLALREIRINADKTRKSLKEDSLRYGKAVQSIYNMIETLIVPTEEHLEKQEKFAEVQELKRVNALRSERQTLLMPYVGYYIQNTDLGYVNESDFEMILKSAKYMKKEAEDAEERKMWEQQEEQKRREEEAEKMRLEREVMLAESNRLKAEMAEKERAMAEERMKLEQEAQAERLRIEQEAQAERDKIEMKLRAERIAKGKLEKELQAKREQEEAERLEAERLEEIELSNKDADKIEKLIYDIKSIKLPQVKSKKSKKIVSDVTILLAKVIAHIEKVDL